MESLYIDRRDTTLSVEASRLIIHHPDMVKAQSVPLTHLRFIVISSNVSLTTNVLQAFSKANIACIILNPRKTDDMTFTMPFRHGHAERRLAQYQLHHRDDLRQNKPRNNLCYLKSPHNSIPYNDYLLVNHNNHAH
jgi:CRISPR/Cas system-associated endonuclease Cas1